MKQNDPQQKHNRTHCRQWLYAFLMLTLWLPLPNAVALSTDKDQPIFLEADSVDIDDGKGVSVYRGRVDVKQGSIHLTADKVTVYQKEKRTDQIIADGNPVTFKQRSDDGQVINGRALHVEYYANSDELFLSNEAVLTQGKDSFASDKIYYDRKLGVVKAGASAQGKQRVRIVIDPSDK